jgi:predicted nucleic acid-binding protein
MNYLIDTNIILDIALERMLFIEDSVQIFLIKETNNATIQIHLHNSPSSY